jgi:hypothetical protein
MVVFLYNHTSEKKKYIDKNTTILLKKKTNIDKNITILLKIKSRQEYNHTSENKI